MLTIDCSHHLHQFRVSLTMPVPIKQPSGILDHSHERHSGEIETNVGRFCWSPPKHTRYHSEGLMVSPESDTKNRKPKPTIISKSMGVSANNKSRALRSTYPRMRIGSQTVFT